jgi:hypothetical protein
MPATGVRNPSGLQVAAYGGANCVLIAMSVPDNQTKDLAGFTIWRRREGEAEQPLLNRLNFDDPITSATTPAQRKWTSSEEAPFQKFRWVDIPPDGVDKPTTYRVRAMYFSGAGKSMHPGVEASVTVTSVDQIHTQFSLVGMQAGTFSDRLIRSERVMLDKLRLVIGPTIKESRCCVLQG